MSLSLDALWINVSPSLRRFDRPLLKILSEQFVVAEWQYCQTADEPMSLEIALVLLHDYVKKCDRPFHLLGHGTGGLLALLYARRHPERVRSLTLLSVGAYPAVDWHTYYYDQLNLLPCPRQAILAQVAYKLLGYHARPIMREFMGIMDKDLSSSLSPHTLYRRVNIFPGRVSVPLLVCGSQDDVVINSSLLQGWQPWLKEGDRLCGNDLLVRASPDGTQTTTKTEYAKIPNIGPYIYPLTNSSTPLLLLAQFPCES